MQIRIEGSYEITIIGKDKRIDEVVSESCLHKVKEEAEALLEAIPEAESYYISKILVNSKYSAWAAKVIV